MGQHLQGKVVSAQPGRVCTPGRAKVDFFRKLGHLNGGSGVNLVVLACVLRATTKNGLNFFLRGGGRKFS